MAHAERHKLRHWIHLRDWPRASWSTNTEDSLQASDIDTSWSLHVESCRCLHRPEAPDTRHAKAGMAPCCTWKSCSCGIGSSRAIWNSKRSNDQSHINQQNKQSIQILFSILYSILFIHFHSIFYSQFPQCWDFPHIFCLRHNCSSKTQGKHRRPNHHTADPHLGHGEGM